MASQLTKNKNTMKAPQKNTYTYQVMQWLNSGRSLTSWQARDEFGCTRLAVVISSLRHDYFMPIVTDDVRVQNRNKRWVTIARYRLKEEA